jgi:arsenite methyltransferase
MREKQLAFLAPIRDRVLQNAEIAPGDTVLDVGAGDGLIAFGALDRVGTSGTVVFSDISRDLLDHCRALARELGVAERCRFLEAPADNLAACADASVDVVTLRSVLIYVEAKQPAFDEFYRVLKPDGRLSLFEPINRFSHAPDNVFRGYDVAPVRALVKKVSAVYGDLQPATDPMLDFDERDLFRMTEKAGFHVVRLELQAKTAPLPAVAWQTFIRMAPNPRVPTLEEAMRQALTAAEIDMVIGRLRPQVEAGRGTGRSAVAYLQAFKR